MTVIISIDDEPSNGSEGGVRFPASFVVTRSRASNSSSIMSAKAEGASEGDDKSNRRKDGPPSSSSSDSPAAEGANASPRPAHPVDAPSPSSIGDGRETNITPPKDESEGAAKGSVVDKSDKSAAAPPPLAKDPTALLFVSAPVSGGRPARQQQERPPRRYSRSASPPRAKNRYNVKKRVVSRPWSDHPGGEQQRGGGADSLDAAVDGESGGDHPKEGLGLHQGLRNLKLPNPPSLRRQLLGVRRWVSQDDSVVGTSTSADPAPSRDDEAKINSNSNPVSALRRRIVSATTSRTPPRDRILKRRQVGEGGGRKPTQVASDSKRVVFAPPEAEGGNDRARTTDEESKLSHVIEADSEEDSTLWLTSRSRPDLSPPPAPQMGGASSLNSRFSSKTIVVGPWVDVLTADATLFFFASAVVAVYPTYVNWTEIVDSQHVPISVALSWAFVAFAAGVATVGIVEDWRIRTSVMSATMRGAASPRLTLPPAAIEFPTEQRMVQEEIMQAQKRNRHSVFLGALRFSSAKVKFQAAQVTQPVVKALLLGSKTWTSLSPTRPALQLWETTADPTLDRHKNNLLMNRLLRNPVYRRVLKVDHLRSQQEKSRRHDAVPVEDDQASDLGQSVRSMGQFELPDADTLNEFVIVPMLKLRGMDVFMTDEPETEVVTHPWLLEQGLRSVPTLVVNLLTPWANLLIYLEMPSWVTKLSDLDIEDDDEEDVKALKHFLNGDSKFRNLRLKMIPSVVDGPLAVRVLAPPKREICISCAILPVSWRSYEADVDAETGRKLAPALEVELDCTSNRAMRSMAGILKRHLQSLAIDVAVVIQKPEEKDDDEPQACLAMWRFNHIDVSKCPTFPDRFEYESNVRRAKETTGPLLDPDVMRASQIVLISTEELEILAAAE